MEAENLNKHLITTDIKAEVVAADLIEGEVDVDDVVILPVGTQERVFSRDIRNLEVKQDRLGDKDQVYISVNREGIYNGLPEALFHVFDRNKRNNSATFVEEYKRHKGEEEAARQFFSAFEKELYRLRTLNELEERKSIPGFADGFKSELFLNLLPELRNLPEKYLQPLVLMLPVAHRVVGNNELAGMMLNYVINEQVKVKYDDTTTALENTTDSHVLGSKFLGIDQVIGHYLPDFSPKIELEIGPIKKGDLLRFLPGGEMRQVVDLVSQYLFAAVADIKVTILLENIDEKLILSDELTDGKLGYTSRL